MDGKPKITDTAILAPMAAAVFVAGLLCGIAIAPENRNAPSSLALPSATASTQQGFCYSTGPNSGVCTYNLNMK